MPSTLREYILWCEEQGDVTLWRFNAESAQAVANYWFGQPGETVKISDQLIRWWVKPGVYIYDISTTGRVNHVAMRLLVHKLTSDPATREVVLVDTEAEDD